jgi:hypothetical protein
MTFLDDMTRVFNTPAIPGIPNSKVGDIFGLGGYFGFGNPIDSLRDAKDKVSSMSKNLPYIIIGGGTLVLIILLKK